MAILIRATSALAEGCPIQMVVAVKLADITRPLPSCSLPADAPLVGRNFILHEI